MAILRAHVHLYQDTPMKIEPLQKDVWLRLGEPGECDIFLGNPGVIKKLLELLEPYKDYP